MVCFTADHDTSFADLTTAKAELIVQAWADRTSELAALPGVQQVFCFENRGHETGVTLDHPHGQIYAYPFVPPVPARQLAQEREYYLQHGTSLLTDMAREEAEDGKRVLYRDDHAIAFVPVGMGAFYFATASGLGTYDLTLLSVHMVQHMILSMLVPMALALGAPVTLALRTLPRRRRPCAAPDRLPAPPRRINPP